MSAPGVRRVSRVCEEGDCGICTGCGHPCHSTTPRVAAIRLIAEKARDARRRRGGVCPPNCDHPIHRYAPDGPQDGAQ